MGNLAELVFEGTKCRSAEFLHESILRPNIELSNPKEIAKHNLVEETKIYKREKKSRHRTNQAKPVIRTATHDIG